jgi:hypothetical protein
MLALHKAGQDCYTLKKLAKIARLKGVKISRDSEKAGQDRLKLAKTATLEKFWPRLLHFKSWPRLLDLKSWPRKLRSWPRLHLNSWPKNRLLHPES